jgi:hypothetical protein
MMCRTPRKSPQSEDHDRAILNSQSAPKLDFSSQLLAQVDQEIAHLQQLLALLKS